MPIFDILTKEWPTLQGAAVSVVGLLIVCLGLGWSAGRFMYGQRIENLKSTISLRDSQLAEVKDKLDGRTPEQAAQRIEKLEERLAAIEPYTLDGDCIRVLSDTISERKAGVIICRDIGSPGLDALYVQLVSIFRTAGWPTESWVSLDTGSSQMEAVPGGRFTITLILRPNVSDEVADLFRRALRAAQLRFSEDHQPNAPSVAVPQIVLSSVQP